MTTQLFNKEGSVQEPESFFSDLVGEGKQFKDQEELAKGKWHSDQHIQRLEKENENARTELQRLLAIQDHLTKTQAAPSKQEEKPVERDQLNIETFKTEIFKQIEDRLNHNNQKETARRNVDRISRELETIWGADYRSRLSARAKEMKLSEEFLGQLAESNPEGFLAIVGAQQHPQRTQSPPRSTTMSSLNTPETGVRNKSYYDKIRKENPKLYWSKETQVAEHRDAVRLGADFFA